MNSATGTSGLFARLDGAPVRALDRLFVANPAWFAATALLAALQTALIVLHQPWSDEYQALAIARDAPGLTTMLGWLRYEGHPPLWYLLLRALDGALPGGMALPAAALLCALAGQTAILHASPFSRAERLLIASSAFVLFDFFTISRGTSLGVAILLVGLALWRRRWIWLAIALLPGVDFLFGVISGILVLLKWRERDMWWPGVALWLAGAALAAWSIRPPPDLVNAFAMLGTGGSPGQWLEQTSVLLIPFQGGVHPQWNSPVDPIGGVAWIGFIALVWSTTRNAPFQRLLMFGFLGFTLVFSLAVYPLGLRHMMLVALVLIAFEWLHRSTNGHSRAGFRLWIAVAALCGLGTAAVALVRPFDAAPRVAALIEEKGLAQAHWMAFPGWRVAGLSEATGLAFERPERHCTQRFTHWDYAPAILAPAPFEQAMKREIALHGRSYLVAELPIAASGSETVRPLATVGPGYDGVTYYLYEIGPLAPERPVSLPPCEYGETGARLGKK